MIVDGIVRTLPFERMTEPESLRLIAGGTLVGVSGWAGEAGEED